MPLHPSLQDIALRLALTMIASALIGFDRGVRGHAAGLRTTILVGLSAALAMIQANLLLPVDGKSSGSFGVLDLMRMPLGILTGVGLIGGGAILKKGDAVSGLTTAATLWLTTVVGLCFGGGQNSLAVAGTALALITLFALKYAEAHMDREHRERLVVRARLRASPGAPPAQLRSLGCLAHFQAQTEEEGRHQTRFAYEVSWRRAEAAGAPLELLDALNAYFEVVSFDMISAAPG
jgi:putative Mg2+ transporter-C (MgtC) family protein